MNAIFRWGLIGPGGIANRFADAVARLDGCELAAVYARDSAKAQVFANSWRQPNQAPIAVFGSAAQLLASGLIDGVYIATPHSSHGDYTRAALLAGIPVLCEKPLVPTLAEFLSLKALAEQRKVFLMEALWTRYLPLYGRIKQLLQDGAIGELQSIASSFCFDVPFDAQHRMFNPALAGGTLLDIGIYNIAVTRWVMEALWGACPEPLGTEVRGVLAPSGVDQRVEAEYAFERGVRAKFICAFDRADANALTIAGSKGSIHVPRNFWEAQTAQWRADGQASVDIDAPFAINGFEYEIQEAMHCIRSGLNHSPSMPWSETEALLRWIGDLRRRLGVVYPFET